jgi:hypothetical protein
MTCLLVKTVIRFHTIARDLGKSAWLQPSHSDFDESPGGGFGGKVACGTDGLERVAG